MTFAIQNARKMGSNIIFSSGFVSSGLTQVGTGALSLPEGFMVHFSLLALCLAWHSQPSIEMNKQGKSAWGEEWDQATQCLELMLAISADHGSVETRRPFRFNFLFYFMTALLVRLGLGPETSGTWNMKKIQTIQWFHAYRCWNAMSDSGLWLGNFLSWLFRHHHPLHLPTCIIIHIDVNMLTCIVKTCHDTDDTFESECVRGLQRWKHFLNWWWAGSSLCCSPWPLTPQWRDKDYKLNTGDKLSHHYICKKKTKHHNIQHIFGNISFIK